MKWQSALHIGVSIGNLSNASRDFELNSRRRSIARVKPVAMIKANDPANHATAARAK